VVIWEDEGEESEIKPTLLGLKRGDVVTYPAGRNCYGFGEVEEERRGSVIIKPYAANSSLLEILKSKVVLQYRREERRRYEECRENERGGVERRVDEDKTGEGWEGESEESRGEGEESKGEHEKKASNRRVVVEL